MHTAHSCAVHPVNALLRLVAALNEVPDHVFSRPFVSIVGFLSLVSSGNAFTNPVKKPGGAGPQVTYFDGWYYFIATEWDDLKLARACSIKELKTAEDRTIYTDLNLSRCCNVWAPELFYLDGKWHIYYTAGESGSNNRGGQRSHVLVDPLSIISQPIETWERSENPVQEGQNALYFGGKIYIAYSASFCWTADYCVALLEYNGSEPMKDSSWIKSNGCSLTSGNGNFGTGHNSYFTSPSGNQAWITFHATPSPSGACDDSRYAMVQSVTSNADGTLNFGQPETFTYEWDELV
ncbi:hypothetical protein N0V95_001461 [Ascochyta clinopodiicola]|nr:hypothetical protein N0V95_001461 [Ascochyta clinopodiicola]